MMKKCSFFFTLAAIFIMVSCNQSAKYGKEDRSSYNWENAQTYVSEDGKSQFLVLADSASEDGIILLDKNAGTVYHLDHLKAASGAKYGDQDGFTFWTKGNDFIWSNHMDMIASGKLQTKDVSGNYVSPDYFQRNEGYDWVAVRVKKMPDDKLLFQVRSRADKKKPSCTLDATAYKQDKNHYYSMIDGSKILFTFKNDTLEIAPENPEDENVLYFYCSGGATVAGKYIYTNEELDPDQVDPTTFSKVLRLQGIGFSVSAVRKDDGMTKITITPFGLQIDNSVQVRTIEGSVVNAEVEDLNSDGSPELFIYTQSDGSGSYGDVMAYSVNNRKSMSMVNFPPITNDSTLSKGYMGHDEFSVVETSLVRRFPVYKDGDSNANPTGGTRQITYKLKEGEAMRQLVVVSVTTLNN